MVLLQKRDEGGLLSGLWECPTSAADEAAPAAEVAAQLLAQARQAASAAALESGSCDASSLLCSQLQSLPASDVRPVGKPFVHMFSHIHRSVRVFAAKVDLKHPHSAKTPRVAAEAAAVVAAACARTHNAKAMLHSMSRLAAAGVPTLTRKVLCSAAAALGYVL